MQATEMLNRMDLIGQSLAASGNGLALIGLGSVGQDTARADEYSNLDFLAVVEPGHKHRYLQQLDWLDNVAPVCWVFHHNNDGCKLWFDDALYCEFAVLEPHELPQAAFASGRVIWKRGEFTNTASLPQQCVPEMPAHNLEWVVGEVLSHLHVGLRRYLRGEKLSAFRMVQVSAMERVLELIERRIDPVAQISRDAFWIDRRFERRYPDFAPLFNGMLSGYANTPHAAECILHFLDEHWPVPEKIVQAVKLQIERARCQ